MQRACRAGAPHLACSARSAPPAAPPAPPAAAACACGAARAAAVGAWHAGVERRHVGPSSRPCKARPLFTSPPCTALAPCTPPSSPQVQPLDGLAKGRVAGRCNIDATSIVRLSTAHHHRGVVNSVDLQVRVAGLWGRASSRAKVGRATQPPTAPGACEQQGEGRQGGAAADSPRACEQQGGR